MSSATRIPSFVRISSSLRATSRFCVCTSIDLAPTTTRQFCFYFFHQAPLLGVDLLLAQIWRLHNEESFLAAASPGRIPTQTDSRDETAGLDKAARISAIDNSIRCAYDSTAFYF